MEGGLLLFDAEAVMGATSSFNFLFLESVLAYGQNHSFAGARHHDRVLKEERVRVFLNVSSRFVVRALLSSFL